MCCAVQEGEALGAYGEWVPVDKTTDKAAAASRKALTTVPIATATSSSGETAPAPGLPEVVEQPAPVPDNDSVFPDPLAQVRGRSTYTVVYRLCVSYNVYWCICEHTENLEHEGKAENADALSHSLSLQPVDISQAVTERIKAQRRLAENPYDVSAICMLSRAQEQVQYTHF